MTRRTHHSLQVDNDSNHPTQPAAAYRNLLTQGLVPCPAILAGISRAVLTSPASLLSFLAPSLPAYNQTIDPSTHSDYSPKQAVALTQRITPLAPLKRAPGLTTMAISKHGVPFPPTFTAPRPYSASTMWCGRAREAWDGQLARAQTATSGEGKELRQGGGAGISSGLTPLCRLRFGHCSRRPAVLSLFDAFQSGFYR